MTVRMSHSALCAGAANAANTQANGSDFSTGRCRLGRHGQSPATRDFWANAPGEIVPVTLSARQQMATGTFFH